MTRPALIVNRKAKQLVASPSRVEAIRALARDRADVFEPRSLTELDDAAEEIYAGGAPAVMLVGGDGTAMAGLSALEHARRGRDWPRVTLGHAGTVGTVARGLGFPRGMTDSIRRFCHGEPGRPFEQATLSARADGERPRVGFIFATGFVARFFEEYDHGDGGMMRAVGLASRLFAGAFVGTALARRVLSPMPCRVSVDGDALEPEAWGVVVSSVLDDVGLHVKATYRGGEDPGRPHLVATSHGPRGLGLNFPRVLAGKTIVGADTFDDLVGEFSVEWKPQGPWVFDGDTTHSARVVVSAGPRVPMALPG